LLILTGQRFSEVAEMHWGEISPDSRTWKLPGERTKNKRVHTVPLASAVLTLLESLPRFARKPGETDYVLGLKPPTGFDNIKKRMDKEVAQLNGGTPIEHWVWHDLRRTLITGMGKLGVPIHVIERIVNHVSGTFAGIVGTYQKHKFEAEKRTALNQWAALIESLVAEGAERVEAEECA
jgi:integrase